MERTIVEYMSINEIINLIENGDIIEFDFGSFYNATISKIEDDFFTEISDVYSNDEDVVEEYRHEFFTKEEAIKFLSENVGVGFSWAYIPEKNIIINHFGVEEL